MTGTAKRLYHLSGSDYIADGFCILVGLRWREVGEGVEGLLQGGHDRGGWERICYLHAKRR